jgi:hypothetical protein
VKRVFTALLAALTLCSVGQEWRLENGAIINAVTNPAYARVRAEYWGFDQHGNLLAYQIVTQKQVYRVQDSINNSGQFGGGRAPVNIHVDTRGPLVHVTNFPQTRALASDEKFEFYAKPLTATIQVGSQLAAQFDHGLFRRVPSSTVILSKQRELQLKQDRLQREFNMSS